MNKKVILFIVEGVSDKNALEPLFSELFNLKKVYFEVLRLDITATYNDVYARKNIKERLTIIIQSFLSKNRGIKKEYIEKVILISDMDGCFIDETYIHYSEDDFYFRYEDDGIYSNNPERVKQRNKFKKENLNNISNAREVFGTIPIETYYFSCNLDHVLHDSRNLEQGLKEEYADAFADDFFEKEFEFINFIHQFNGVEGNDYKSSWNHIEVGLNSLLRFSNLYVMFVQNQEYMMHILST